MTDLDTRRPEFTVAIRGYDRMQVDEYIERLQELLSEAEERVRTAEANHDFGPHASIGPRLSEIFELAGAETRELRSKVEQETKEQLATARAESAALVAEARETAKAVADQAALEYAAMLAEFEQERDQIRAQVDNLEERKAAFLDELRRLHGAIGAAFGVVELPRQDTVVTVESSEMKTAELPQRTEERKAS